MTETEKKKNELFSLRDRIEERIAERYEKAFLVYDGKQCYKSTGEHYFLITALCWLKDGIFAIVVEHAEGKEEAQIPRFEDGDLFYIDEMSENEIFDAIINEIEE